MRGAGNKGLLLLFALIALATLFFSYQQLSRSTDDSGSLISLDGRTMGTGYRVLLQADEAFNSSVNAELQAAIETRLVILDKTIFSTYVPDSEISVFNQADQGVFNASPEFITVLQRALEIHRLSDGAFDPSLKPVVDLWGFGTQVGRQEVPSPDVLAAVFGLKGLTDIRISSNAGTVQKKSGVAIDLSGIAKGFAVDEIGKLLEERGISNFLVEIGGEVLSVGNRPDGAPWQLGIERPVAGKTELLQPIRAHSEKMAVAGSGNYRNYFVHEGQRYSHIIDPRTGWPVSHELLSVTVIAESTMEADAWATALFVLGPEAGVRLANELQLAAYFALDNGAGIQSRHSDAFNRYL